MIYSQIMNDICYVSNRVDKISYRTLILLSYTRANSISISIIFHTNILNYIIVILFLQFINIVLLLENE